MEITCALLDRFYHALADSYPESFYLLVEWFSDYDHDGFMKHEVLKNGFLPVSDLPSGPTRERYKALAFLVALGFELKLQRGVDVVHYHRVTPDVMFKLRQYIRTTRTLQEA